jgi:hypothetical protein
MSQLNDINYVNQVPLAADYAPFVVDADGTVKTATMQQLADLFASLSSQSLTPVFISVDTILSTQQFAVFIAAGATNQTLPASALNAGRAFALANKGAGTVTVLPNGTDTIEGAVSLALAQYETAVLRSDGLGMYHRF